MDQIKIGTFIAANRKRLGLTQVQLAEQLGVSNKSVSKWERGVCLPDVSLYQPLCEILDITLTEFFAGEKLSEETLVQRTEETIMEVSMKGKQNVDKLKKWLIAASVIVLGLLLCILYFFYKTGGFYQNMIWKAPVRSGEMEVAELATGTDGVLLYNWKAGQEYHMYAWISPIAKGAPLLVRRSAIIWRWIKPAGIIAGSSCCSSWMDSAILFTLLFCMKAVLSAAQWKYRSHPIMKRLGEVWWKSRKKAPGKARFRRGFL